MNLNITIDLDKAIGCYTIENNGEVLLECLSKQDVEELTIGELIELIDESLEEPEEVNEKTMCKLLGEMSDYVNEMLERWGLDGSYYIDERKWGNDCFKIRIFNSYGKLDDSFFFKYDRSDEESCYEQALSKLSAWLSDWHKTMN